MQSINAVVRRQLPFSVEHVWNTACRLQGLAAAQTGPRLSIKCYQRALGAALQHDRMLRQQLQHSSSRFKEETEGTSRMSLLSLSLHFKLADLHRQLRHPKKATAHYRTMLESWERELSSPLQSRAELLQIEYQIYCLARLALRVNLLHAPQDASEDRALFSLPDPAHAAADSVEAEPLLEAAPEEVEAEGLEVLLDEEEEQELEQEQEQEPIEPGGPEQDPEERPIKPAVGLQTPLSLMPQDALVKLAQIGIRMALELSGGPSMPPSTKLALSYDYLGAAFRLSQKPSWRRHAKKAHELASTFYKKCYSGGIHRHSAFNQLLLGWVCFDPRQPHVAAARQHFAAALHILTEYYRGLLIDQPHHISPYQLARSKPSAELPYAANSRGEVYPDPSCLLFADALHALAQTHELSGSASSALRSYRRELAVLYRCLTSGHPRVQRLCAKCQALEVLVESAKRLRGKANQG